MPCYTQVQLVNLDDDKWNRKAREKLGLPLEGAVQPEDAKRIRVEAGKFKTAEAMKKLKPGAIIKGMTAGSKKLTIQVDI